MTPEQLIDSTISSELETPQVSKLRKSLFGYLLYHCLSKRRKIVLDNINQVYQDKLSEQEKIHLTIALFSHVARTVKESYYLHRGKKSFQPTVEIRGIDHLSHAVDAGKGVIILCAHMGNWELCLLRAYQKEINLVRDKFYVLRRRQLPRLQKVIEKNYHQVGVKIIERNGAIRTSCNILRNQGILFFTFDQHMRLQKKQGIPVEFFGKKTGCHRSLAVLAARTGAAVVPLNQYRIGHNHHVLEFHPALPWIDSPNKTQALHDNTLQYNHVLEQFILQHPEQWWCWLHRHWR